MSDRDFSAIASWMWGEGPDPGRVADRYAACVDHRCRRCGHAWFSNRCDTNCELCGSDDIQDTFDESPSDDRDWWEGE